MGLIYHRRRLGNLARRLGLGLVVSMVALPGAAAAPTDGSVQAQQGVESSPGGSIEFRGHTARLENDLFADTDNNYTNGVSLTAISRNVAGNADLGCLPLPLRLHAALIGWLDPGFWRGSANSSQPQNVVVKMGQSMYTPTDAARSDLISNDRPYAGLLYVGLSWNRRRLDEQAKVEMLDTREVTLGVIGPLSMARQTQDLVHRVNKVERFQGWDHQLGNEPALQLACEQKWRDHRGVESQLAGFSADSIRSLSLRLGNIETSASVGIEGRIGWNMPNDFGSYPIRPGAENRPPTTPALRDGSAQVRARPGAHLFAMLEGRLVAYDFTLDGNLLRSSHSVTRRPLVAQASIGFSVYGPLAGYGVKLSLMRVVRSREFDEQAQRHAFGSIALSVEY
ncbi:MAG: lipid A deacylase LpxR family protein [Rubrivivax sp.]|nr:lipid A deacylase LpxR family protein [Rubrivivax sp.]